MTPIIAGRFEEEAQAGRAAEALRQRGFDKEDVTVFYLNPPGQHATFPVGGDRDRSHGATDAHSGALKGAAIGGVVGLGVGVAAAPLVGPVGALAGAGAGAYVGSLAGALGDMGESDSAAKEAGQTPPEAPADGVPMERPAGFIVAARAPEYALRVMATNVLQSMGAKDVERADGSWQMGKWVDFDPLQSPKLVDLPASGHGSTQC
ncbi:MAG TPA: hypothetical protein VGK37_06610 [Casimicrobiaceae bacterium]|jgi:hypothetical protein